MNILVITATEAEIAPSIKHIQAAWSNPKDGFYHKNDHNLEFMTTGVGMVPTTYNLTKAILKSDYDLIIQAGIGGSFDRNIALGEVVVVGSDTIADLGAEDGKDFLDIFQLDLSDSHERPFTDGVLKNLKAATIQDIRVCRGITINTVTGSEYTAAKWQEKYNCDIESMEGAALHYVCLRENIDFLQVRAISNYVERRNKSSWKLSTAIENLNTWLISYIEQL